MCKEKWSSRNGEEIERKGVAQRAIIITIIISHRTYKICLG